MAERSERFPPKLSLIPGGRNFEIWFEKVRIVAAPETNPPFEVDAVAFEEDRFLVLSADPVVREPREHPLKILRDALTATPESPGTVVVRGKDRPLRFLAIVHDLNQEPTWREEWVARALAAIFGEAERRTLHSVALPVLGSRYGRIEKARFVFLLRTTLGKTSIRHLRRLWLMVPPEEMEATRGVLMNTLQQ